MACLPCASNARAVTDWADWVDSTLVPTRVNGALNGQAITFTGTGPMLAPQTGAAGQPIYWFNNSATYTGGAVTNPPVTSDIIRLLGPGVFTITFAQPVTNPVMALLSFGGLTPISFDFGTQPFTILKSGPGTFGNRAPLTQTGNVLFGTESNGLIQFQGTMTTLTWSMPVAETWTGFTIGIDDTVNLPAPPSPSLPPGQVGGLLSWAYNYPVEQLIQRGFVLYRGLETQCDDPAPLAVEVGRLVDPLARTYADLTLPSSTVRACYEVSAYNEVGESPHSNRAGALIADLIPAVPGPITVRVLAE